MTLSVKSTSELCFIHQVSGKTRLHLSLVLALKLLFHDAHNSWKKKNAQCSMHDRGLKKVSADILTGC